MKITKEQIITGWSFRRVLSVILGSIIIYKSFLNQEAISAIFGVALVAMGILNVGCAGDCCGGSCSYPITKKEIKE